MTSSYVSLDAGIPKKLPSCNSVTNKSGIIEIEYKFGGSESDLDGWIPLLPFTTIKVETTWDIFVRSSDSVQVVITT